MTENDKLLIFTRVAACLLFPAVSACGSCPLGTVAPETPTTEPCPSKTAEVGTPLIPVPKPSDRDPRNGRFACGWTGEILEPGSTYHVRTDGNDANPGTSKDQAFATLQKAADTVQPGDTVLVHSGTYRGKPNSEAVLNIHTSGTERAPIVFKVAEGAHPIIKIDKT